MSLEFLESFDHYTSGVYAARKWDATSNGSTAAGRFAGNSWNIQNENLLLRTGQLGAVATRTVGFAFRPLTFSTQVFFVFSDGTTAQVDLRLTSGGAIQVARAGTVLGTSTPVLSTASWVYIEFQATIHASAGAFTLKVWSGASPGVWLTASGVNTQNTANAYTNGLWFQGVSPQYLVDDIYVLNSSGSVNNTFLGDCRIYTTLPSADNTSATGTNKLWTPNAGTTHYTQVDETNPDDDTTYVSSATVGQIDTYQYPDISPTGVIAGVQAVLCDRKDDAAARTICAEYRSGAGTNYDGATVHSPTTSYLFHRQLWETDPATSAAWTATGINAGEFGVKVVS